MFNAVVTYIWTTIFVSPYQQKPRHYQDGLLGYTV